MRSRRFGGNVAAVGLCWGFLLPLAGCASLPEPAIHVAAVHSSQPMRGPGTAPIGDHGQLSETTLDGFEVGIKARQGRWFAETDMTYITHDTYFVGGPWLFTAKVGVVIYGERND